MADVDEEGLLQAADEIEEQHRRGEGQEGAREGVRGDGVLNSITNISGPRTTNHNEHTPEGPLGKSRKLEDWNCMSGVRTVGNFGVRDTVGAGHQPLDRASRISEQNRTHPREADAPRPDPPPAARSSGERRRKFPGPAGRAPKRVSFGLLKDTLTRASNYVLETNLMVVFRKRCDSLVPLQKATSRTPPARLPEPTASQPAPEVRRLLELLRWHQGWELGDDPTSPDEPRRTLSHFTSPPTRSLPLSLPDQI